MGHPHFLLVRPGPPAFGVEAVAFFAVPDCVFVQLYPLLRNASEDHSAQPTVADGQGVIPLLCRVLVPENWIGGE
jgi:hypothetical protein